VSAHGSYRTGTGEPLVLIHGFSGVPGIWAPIVGRLEEQGFDILCVALSGHAGGSPLPEGTSASVNALADQVQAEMDAAGFETAHIVGNSLGGWIALELANHGRARSVSALAPAGGWHVGSREEKRLKALFTRNHAITQRALPYMEKLVARPRLRRIVLGQVMARGDRITPSEALAIVQGAADCEIYFDLMDAILRDGPPREFGSVECPVLLMWGSKDRILPRKRYSARIRELVPSARWVELQGLGHCPMGDDPELVARTIAEFAHEAHTTPQPVG
jgi:pimeloyl-ACP methyl ester carboxylesterase